VKLEVKEKRQEKGEEGRMERNVHTGCPRTGSPEKKGSLRANILTCIWKKKVLSQMITEKRHSEVDQSELSTIKVE
jgi:hypothetical protein